MRRQSQEPGRVRLKARGGRPMTEAAREVLRQESIARLAGHETVLHDVLNGDVTIVRANPDGSKTRRMMKREDWLATQSKSNERGA